MLLISTGCAKFTDTNSAMEMCCSKIQKSDCSGEGTPHPQCCHFPDSPVAQLRQASASDSEFSLGGASREQPGRSVGRHQFHEETDIVANMGRLLSR